MSDDAELINQTSGHVEYYTPKFIVCAARNTMGSIDLDPASCAIANKSVKAKRYFSVRENGFKRKWFGNVWLNHTFGRRENACPSHKSICERYQATKHKKIPHVCHQYELYGNEAWIEKLMKEWFSGRIQQSCNITFASTSESWFQPLMDFPQCYLSPRTNYYDESGNAVEGVTKGSVVTYLGNNVDRFIYCFRDLGKVMLPASVRLHELPPELPVPIDYAERSTK